MSGIGYNFEPSWAKDEGVSIIQIWYYYNVDVWSTCEFVREG